MKNMKKLFTPLILTLFLVLAAVPVMALAEGETAAATPTEPLTWAYLATIAGAATFTLLVVQLFKVPLDKVWKIPTEYLCTSCASLPCCLRRLLPPVSRLRMLRWQP